MRQAERRQHDEQVHLGDAELDVLTLRREFPVERRRDALALEGVGHRMVREQAAPVHPRSEIGGHGDVRRRGDDALREVAVVAADLVEDRAEAGLRRHCRLDADRQFRGHGDGRRLEPAVAGGGERHAVEESLHFLGGHVQALELVPLMAFAHILRVAVRIHLRRRHQAGVVVLVAGHRQAEALHCIADEAGRLVAVGAMEGLQQRRQVVAAEIVHQRREFGVGALFDQPRDVALIADLVEQALAPGCAAGEHQRRVELVGAAIDPGLEPVATGLLEGRLLQRAVLHDDDLPAEILKQLLVALPQAFAHHGIQALAVVVDDPPTIAQALLPAFEQRFEDVAFVELGVAEQRYHAALGAIRAPAVRAHIVLHQRRE